MCTPSYTQARLRIPSSLFLLQLLDEIPHRVLIPSLPTIHLETQRFDRGRVVIPCPGLADGDHSGVFGIGYKGGGLVPAEFLAVLRVMDGIWGDVMVDRKSKSQTVKKGIGKKRGGEMSYELLAYLTPSRLTAHPR